MISNLLIAFVPIFVAMDAIGGIPIYLGLVHDLDQKARRKILLEAVVTAGLIGVSFVFLGKGLFHFLSITISDFKIAGGLVLLILSVHDLIFSDKKERSVSDSIGIVPLGMPLIVGPAVLTAMIILVDSVGPTLTIVSFALNLAITFTAFLSANQVVRLLGKGGTQALSKISNLLLASIAVMIIRSGIVEIIRSEILKG